MTKDVLACQPLPTRRPHTGRALEPEIEGHGHSETEATTGEDAGNPCHGARRVWEHDPGKAQHAGAGFTSQSCRLPR